MSLSVILLGYNDEQHSWTFFLALYYLKTYSRVFKPIASSNKINKINWTPEIIFKNASLRCKANLNNLIFDI